MDEASDEPQTPEGSVAPESPTIATPRHGLLRYTLVRFALVVVVAAVLWLIGIRSNPLLLVALSIVISGIISIFALNRARDDASASVSGVFSRINRRIDDSARAEDDVR